MFSPLACSTALIPAVLPRQAFSVPAHVHDHVFLQFDSFAYGDYALWVLLQMRISPAGVVFTACALLTGPQD